ncbi:MAG TPA: DUF1385 domain-containing protein [Firmicutes bacterium]|nr:DUF1385 domain-containing protein [Candidatus Fermentithermobacillaceae bacterium]
MSKDNRPSYGGQAVIEGVMMRGPRHMVLSVRDPDGKVVSLSRTPESLAQRSKLARLPVIRGAVSLWESLSLGIQMLMKSAEIASPEEEQPSESALSLAVLFAIVVGLGVFVLLPAYVTPWIMKSLSVSGRYWAGFIETGFRLMLLVGYVVSISRMEDIQRVLEYHGAEHKVIWAYENNTVSVEQFLGNIDTCGSQGGFQGGSRDAVEFLVEKAVPETTLHPRCGTSFLFIAVIVTWVVFLFVSPQGFVARVAARLAMLPVIAGIAHEVLKNSSRREGLFWNLVKAPGIAMQKLTTREPDKSQLEVAATSLVLLMCAESNTGRA